MNRQRIFRGVPLPKNGHKADLCDGPGAVDRCGTLSMQLLIQVELLLLTPPWAFLHDAWEALLFDATNDGFDFADGILGLRDGIPKNPLNFFEITVAVAAWFEWIDAFGEECAKSDTQHVPDHLF